MEGQDPQELGDPREDPCAQSRPLCDPGAGMSCSVSGPRSPEKPCDFAGSWLHDESCYPGPAWAPVAARQPCLPSLSFPLRFSSHLVPHLSCPPTRLPVLPGHQYPLGLPLPRPSLSVGCVLRTTPAGHLLMSLIPRDGCVSVSLLGGQAGRAFGGRWSFCPAVALSFSPFVADPKGVF